MKTLKIHRGKYLYRGVTIECLGYYESDHCVVWEGSIDGRCGDYHGKTLKEIKYQIDDDLDK